MTDRKHEHEGTGVIVIKRLPVLVGFLEKERKKERKRERERERERERT